MNDRWITPDEIAELYKRAKFLLETSGSKGKHCELHYSVYTSHGWIRAYKSHEGVGEGTLHLTDQVANVGVFDWDTGAVREIFGSTAKNVLVALRPTMLLEDVAGLCP